MLDKTDMIKEHLDHLLHNAPNTRRVEEMRQELLAGCLDKYADLVADGMEPELAYQAVIDGIGDVKELLGIIEKADAFDPVAAEEKRKKKSFTTSAGLCCYFIGVGMSIMFGLLHHAFLGFGLFIVFFAIGTLLIMFGKTINVNYQRADDTLVEDLKAQMSEGKRETKLRELASSTLWSLVVVLYIAISFLTMDWYITWIIFPFAAAIQCCISAWFTPQTRSKSLLGAYWCLVTTVYLLLSFVTFHWAITWIIFPLAVAIQQAIRMFIFWRGEE